MKTTSLFKISKSHYKMSSLLTVSLILFMEISVHNTIVESINLQSIQEDLDEFQKSCKEDTCDYTSDTFWACHCSIQCTFLDTCCLDSPYINASKSKEIPACRTVHKNQAFYMVDHCFSNDGVYASLCYDEKIQDDDVQKIVPVTSLTTSVTYKNYYCFMCNEQSDDFMYWNLDIKSEYSLSADDEEIDSDISLIYDKASDTLRVSYRSKRNYFPVQSSVKVPSEIINITHVCERDIMSDCIPEWPDEDVRDKCHSYTALKNVLRDDRTVIVYKNIHCALCNNESLDDVSCKKIMRRTYGVRRPGYGGGYRDRDDHRYGDRDDDRYRDDERYRSRDADRYGSGHRKRPGYNRFSFTYLLDINRSDGELVGMIQKCPEDHRWDPFAKKCRKLTCALPGFKIKGTKCVQE